MGGKSRSEGGDLAAQDGGAALIPVQAQHPGCSHELLLQSDRRGRARDKRSSRRTRLPVRSTSHRRRSGPGRVTGPLEAVEDQVEPELVLVAVVVAGLKDVLDGQLA